MYDIWTINVQTNKSTTDECINVSTNECIIVSTYKRINVLASYQHQHKNTKLVTPSVQCQHETRKMHKVVTPFISAQYKTHFTCYSLQLTISIISLIDTKLTRLRLRCCIADDCCMTMAKIRLIVAINGCE